MSASTHVGGSSLKRAWLHPDALIWGTLASIAVLLLGTATSALEVSRVEREVISAFREGERATQLIGRLGLHNAHARLALQDGIARRRADIEHISRERAHAELQIRRTAAELEPLLQARERPLWAEIMEILGRLVTSRDDVMRALRAGDTHAAERVLDALSPVSAEFNEQLTILNDKNRANVDVLLGQVQRRLSLLLQLELFIGSVLVLAVTIAWMTAIREVGRQRLAVTNHVSKIEAAKSDLDAFAGRIAHDLRAVLTPLLLSANSLRNKASDPDAVRKISGRVERAATKASAMIEGLLAFSRAGSLSTVHESCSVADEARSCVEELQPLADQVGASISCQIACDRPVRMSAALLHIVLVNVVGNAIKYLERRPQREVRIAARAEDGECVITVYDTGRGIPAAALPRLFEPFYRVPGTRIQGTGIGLATVHRLVCAHAGRIEIASELDRGTRVEIRLPITVNAPVARSG